GEEEEKYYYSHLSEDGERLYYITSEDNPSFMNNRVRNLRTGEDELLNEGKKAPTRLIAVSPDEESFVYLQSYANTYMTAHVITEGEKYNLTPKEEEVHIVYGTSFTDDQTLYFVTNYDAEYNYLAKF